MVLQYCNTRVVASHQHATLARFTPFFCCGSPQQQQQQQQPAHKCQNAMLLSKNITVIIF
jgi:hypothetical protein